MPRNVPTVASNPGSTVAVGTTSTAVVPANPERIIVHLVNASDTDITLRYAVSGAVVGSGIVLRANGGSLSEEWYNGPICAVHAGVGTKSLGVAEV